MPDLFSYFLCKTIGTGIIISDIVPPLIENQRIVVLPVHETENLLNYCRMFLLIRNVMIVFILKLV
jgi:hypothetical protein